MASSPVKRKLETSAELRPSKRQRHPPRQYESDPALDEAIRRSIREMIGKPAACIGALRPLDRGRFHQVLTPEHDQIHQLMIQHFQKTKTSCFTEQQLQGICLPQDPSTGIPQNLRIIDGLARLGKGVFLSHSADSIIKGDVLCVYEGEIQIIAPSQKEEVSRYKWTLFDFDLEKRNGKKPNPALKGWSAVVDGVKNLKFPALINACHPDCPRDANVEPLLILLEAPDQPTTAQILYVATKTISGGKQLLINYDWSYFKNLKISPLQITPTTYTLNDKDLLISVQPGPAEASLISSKSSSSNCGQTRLKPLPLPDDFEESPPSSSVPFSSSSSTRPSSRFSSTLEEDDYKEEPLRDAQPVLPFSFPLPPHLPHRPQPTYPAQTLLSWTPMPSSIPVPSPVASSFNAPTMSHPPSSAPQRLSASQIKTMTSLQNQEVPLTPEEVNERIKKIQDFLSAIGLTCEEQIEELRSALRDLSFPKQLFITFYDKIKNALFRLTMEESRALSLELREKLHCFTKILWGKEGLAETDCLKILFSTPGAPLWWLKTHSHFVQIFTEKERCRPPIQYVL